MGKIGTRQKTGLARVFDEPVSVFVPALIGLACYVVLMTNAFDGAPERDFGTFIYNHYFLSVIDGRLDIPPRIIGMEGLYAPDGRAFTSHGLAPLISRALAWPFVDLRETSVAAASILGFTALGSAIYHLIFARIVLRFGPTDRGARRSVLLLVGFAVWIATPGIILASNNSFYHEQYALAFFFSAAWLSVAAGAVLFGTPVARIVPWMALFAGLMVHARPHVALGLYAGTIVFLAWAVVEERGRAFPRVVTSLLTMFAFGALYLVVNDLRSGSPLGLSPLKWGFYHFGEYTAETPRVALNQGASTFDPSRIPGNALLYFFDLPRGFGGEALAELHRWMTRPFGFVGVESPRLGLAFFCAPWVYIIVASIRLRHVGLRVGWVLVLSCIVGPFVLLSFAILALRYRVEFWPMIAALALLTLPRAVGALDNAAAVNRFKRVMVLALIITALSLTLALPYSIPGWGTFGDWSRAECVERFEQKGLDDAQIARACTLP